MDFANRLRALARPDLEELLARRREALRLRDRPEAGWAELAAVLAEARGIRAAIDSLDRFHRQVLDLASLAGGGLTPELAEQEGLTASRLDAAAAELARWGLAFPDAGGLQVPRCVVEALPNPGAIGQPAASLFERLRVEELRLIATNLALDRKPARKDDLVAVVSDRLGNLQLVRSLVDQAPPKARSVLDALRANGGSLSWSDLAERVPGVLVERGLWYAARREEENRGVSWLRARGLVVAADWEYSLTVPAEVEVALRERLFPTWEPDAPPLELSALSPDRHPADLVIEVEGLLDLWRREPATLLQGGDLGAREVRRAAPVVGIPEGALRFLAGLSSTAGLLAVEDPPPPRRSSRRKPAPMPALRVVVPEAALDDWLNDAVADRWLALVDPWLARLTERSALVVALLAELPPGQGARVERLARRLAWRHPAQIAGGEEAVQLVAMLGATLHRLALATAGPVLGLTDLGRLVLDGASSDVIGRRFPPLETTCTVTADLRVIVAGPPEPDLARGLARLADLEASSPARVYRLSETSLRRALDGGMSADAVVSFLEGRSPVRLPQNILALVEDVGRRHGRLRIGSAALYLQADDPALLGEVAASRRLRDFEVRRVAPTVAVVTGGDQKRLLEVLRRAGYMPALAGASPVASAPSPPSDPTRVRRQAAARRAPLEKRTNPLELDAGARRALAVRLLRSRAPAKHRPAPEPSDTALLGGVAVTEPRHVLRLLQLAAKAGEAVEIDYENQQSGRVSRRVIEPRLVTEHGVVGWCRLRGAERVFAMAGVRAARATGEPSAVLSLDLDSSEL